MLSRVSTKWRWYDWIIVLMLVIIVISIIHIIAPASGLAHALHNGFHALALGVQWIGNGLLALAGILNQL